MPQCVPWGIDLTVEVGCHGLVEEGLAMHIQRISRVPTYPSEISNSNLDGHAGAAFVGSGQVVA
jgi:hypothetical protein